MTADATMAGDFRLRIASTRTAPRGAVDDERETIIATAEVPGPPQRVFRGDTHGDPEFHSADPALNEERDLGHRAQC
jgi:hypothetical protein